MIKLIFRQHSSLKISIANVRRESTEDYGKIATPSSIARAELLKKDSSKLISRPSRRFLGTLRRTGLDFSTPTAEMQNGDLPVVANNYFSQGVVSIAGNKHISNKNILTSSSSKIKDDLSTDRCKDILLITVNSLKKDSRYFPKTSMNEPSSNRNNGKKDRRFSNSSTDYDPFIQNGYDSSLLEQTDSEKGTDSIPRHKPRTSFFTERNIAADNTTMTTYSSVPNINNKIISPQTPNDTVILRRKIKSSSSGETDTSKQEKFNNAIDQELGIQNRVDDTSSIRSSLDYIAKTEMKVLPATVVDHSHVATASTPNETKINYESDGTITIKPHPIRLSISKTNTEENYHLAKRDSENVYNAIYNVKNKLHFPDNKFDEIATGDIVCDTNDPIDTNVYEERVVKVEHKKKKKKVYRKKINVGPKAQSIPDMTFLLDNASNQVASADLHNIMQGNRGTIITSSIVYNDSIAACNTDSVTITDEIAQSVIRDTSITKLSVAKKILRKRKVKKRVDKNSSISAIESSDNIV